MSDSKLEQRFLTLWLELAPPSLTLIREFQAIAGRKFRFDFYCVEASVLVEIQGGAFTGGRHTRGVGMSSDCEKSRLAQMQGYKCFAYTGQQITKANLTELVDYCITEAKKQKRKRKPQQNTKERYSNGTTNVRRQGTAKAPVDKAGDIRL